MTEKTSRVQLNWLLDQGRNLCGSHWLQTVLMSPLTGLFAVDFWICHWRENTGVIHNINNGSTWFKCPSKPICTIPGNVFPLILSGFVSGNSSSKVILLTVYSVQPHITVISSLLKKEIWGWMNLQEFPNVRFHLKRPLHYTFQAQRPFFQVLGEMDCRSNCFSCFYTCETWSHDLDDQKQKHHTKLTNYSMHRSSLTWRGGLIISLDNYQGDMQHFPTSVLVFSVTDCWQK